MLIISENIMSANHISKTNRGYHTVARRYEFDSWLAKQYFMNKHSKWVKYCFGCKFWRKINEIMLIRNSCVRLWKLNHSDRRCSFYSFHECYIFQKNTHVYIMISYPITDYKEPYYYWKYVDICKKISGYAKKYLCKFNFQIYLK